MKEAPQLLNLQSIVHYLQRHEFLRMNFFVTFTFGRGLTPDC